jgi:hypothetical protein
MGNTYSPTAGLCSGAQATVPVMDTPSISPSVQRTDLRMDGKIPMRSRGPELWKKSKSSIWRKASSVSHKFGSERAETSNLRTAASDIVGTHCGLPLVAQGALSTGALPIVRQASCYEAGSWSY